MTLVPVMRKAVFLFLSLLSVTAFSQQMDAVAFINKVMDTLKSDAVVELSYDYKLYDDEGVELQGDKGVMMLDGMRYVLLMEDMKVWCDGKSQWSYMESVDEIYITDAASDEAQNMSPLFIMESCRDGYASSVAFDGGDAVVTLVAQDAEGVVEKVEFVADSSRCTLKSMKVFLVGQGYIVVGLNGYKANCKVDDGVFECPVRDFKSAVVVDMR